MNTLYTPTRERDRAFSSPALTRLALTFNLRACGHVCVCECVTFHGTLLLSLYLLFCCGDCGCCHCCWWRLISARICANVSLEFELRSRQRRLSALKFGTLITVATDRCRRVCVKINVQNKFKFPNKTNCVKSAKIYKSNASFDVRCVL